MSTKRKLKTLTLREKSEVINAVKSGMKKKDIAAQFGLPASTLSTIIKNKAEILQRYESSSNLSSKRRRLAVFPDLEECLLTWLKQCREKNLSVSGPILREKAEELSKSLGHSTFRASNGWLGNFKKRHEVVFKNDCGENASVNNEILNRTESRIDQSQRTENGGNSDCKIDDTDKLVLEIIGKESPVNEGICDSDTVESPEASRIKEEDVTPSPPQELSQSLETIDVAETSKKTVLVINKTNARNLNNLKIRKLKLEIRKLELEVWEKERNLNIPHCNLTTHIDPLEDASGN